MYIGAAPADPGPARTAPQIRIQFQECRCRQDAEDKLPGGYDMAVRENENREIVNMIREGLRQRNGYCPCRVEMIPENKCVCKEFREQIADPDFEGYCHCMLFYKSKD